ncbi:hypothetical protein FA15DRAFT_634495 [Coprinopsis marcescibilis]|uniref:Wax synthase domain-containing protein n=1 Tax=Coprinopsis marcescibilis TaxID=230819 RepID=A0A5C3L630_COPMA|nr:hypothetical protein FA15DRAFT_634495 [Coprinopsis marcescibilis]
MEMDWLSELVPPPETRLPVNIHNVAHLLVPPILFYYATAVLVILPGTFYARLALLPLTLWSAFRASTKLDFALPFDDDRLIYLNHGLLLVMTALALKAIVWTSELNPYYRVKPGTTEKLSGSEPEQPSLWQVATDAFDLSVNLRGLGWNWSKGLCVPKEWRPTDSRTRFLLPTFKSVALTILVCDFLHFTIQWLGPTTFGTSAGGTIFDPSLPPLQRYIRSTFISFLGGFVIVNAIQLGYYGTTIVGVLVFRGDPANWPPAFEEPWFATSLNEFWTKRWHQIFRDIFIGVGAKPLYLIFGKPGIVAGAFLVSAVLHVFGLWGMGRGTEFWSVGGFFLLMGFGIVLEHVYKAATGKRVGGYAGHMWTIIWVVGWGNLLIDAWFRKGLAGSVFFPAGWRPTEIILDVVKRIAL